MNTSYPAFLLFHNWNNCFGYARNLTDFGGIPLPMLSLHPTTATLLGYFRVRSCDDPHLTFYVQVFGSLPFSHLYVNSVFAILCGFEENQEVILEIVSVASCTSVEIAPLTANDFEILDKRSSHVEETFLDQIRLVYPKMQFPFWVSPGVHASFKIESISPATDNAVYLGSSTELHIVPVKNDSLPISKIDKKSSESIVEMTEKIFSKMNEIISPGCVFCSLTVCQKVFRVVPRLLIDKYKALDHAAHPCVIYAVNPGIETYAAYSIVSFECNVSSQNSYALLIEIPLFVKPREGVAQAVLNILQHRSDHCIAFNKNCEDYTKISCSSIDRRMIYILKLADVSLSKSDGEWIFGENKEQELLNSLSQFVAVYPLLFSINGISFFVPLPERGVTVKILPSALDLGNVYCSVSKMCFMVNSQCNFSVQKVPFYIEQEPECVDIQNFGITAAKSALHLEYQSQYLRDLSNWIEYGNLEEWIGHALMLGAEGSGKSVVAARLARNLAKSPRCWFSLRVDCSSWKGKQAENIEKSLAFQIKKLQQRSPSFLILDDIDFLNIENEDEHRQVGVERIFYKGTSGNIARVLRT